MNFKMGLVAATAREVNGHKNKPTRKNHPPLSEIGGGARK